MTFLFALLLSIPSDPAALCALDPLPDDVDTTTLDVGALESMISAMPDCMPAHYLAGRAILGAQDRDLDEAIGRLEAARDLAAENARVLQWLGQAYLARAGEKRSLSDAGTGRKLVEQAIRIDPDYLQARVVLGSFHRQAPWFAGGDIDVAYEQATEIRKRDLTLGLLEQARTLRADGEEEQALKLAESSLAQFPGYAPLAIEYAVLMVERKDYAAAHDALLAATREEGASLMALYQLGRTAALAGQFSETGRQALKRYLARGQAGEKLPFQPAAAWWRLGLIEQQDGNVAAARTAFETSLELNPEFEDAAKALKELAP